MKRGATWIRVSSDGQDEKSQNHDIDQFCRHHNIDVVKRYELHDKSAYKGEHEAMLKQMLLDAHKGEFEVLVVWMLDRIERRGAERVLRLIRLLKERNCTLASVNEDWLDMELMVSVRAWMDSEESRKKSERILMGMAERRRKLERGEEVKGRQAMGGRVKGSRNKKPRPKLTGERAGWTPERKAELAARNTQRQWTPEQKLEAARISHRRTCPVPDCMETKAHD